MKKLALAVSVAVLSTAFASSALASCRIKNETKWDFTVESGNTSNQRVTPNTTTSIASGKIKGKDAKSGKTISGSCKDGDELVIKDEDGIPVVEMK